MREERGEGKGRGKRREEGEEEKWDIPAVIVLVSCHQDVSTETP